MFKWKYPLWYSRNIKMEDCTIEAPKTFRRASGIELNHVTMPNAGETLWNCDQVKMNQVTAKGDYFAMNSSNMVIDGFELIGNYSFDGVKNVEIHNARMLSKDAFWNSENVTVYKFILHRRYFGLVLIFALCYSVKNQKPKYFQGYIKK